MTTTATRRQTKRRDSQIRDDLQRIEASDFPTSPWEARFIEAMLWRYGGRLTRRQRAAAERICERYLPEPRRPAKRTTNYARDEHAEYQPGDRK